MTLIPQDKRTILCSFSNEKGAIFNDGRGLSVSTFVPIKCPYGQPGDRLWVRETWAKNKGTGGGIVYRADYGFASGIYECDLNSGDWVKHVDKWKPSIYMPRWASRITLEVTDVRVERVQDITPQDIEAEGFFLSGLETQSLPDQLARRKEWFRNAWNTINAKRGYSWGSNPWTWAISFKVVK